MENGRIRCSVGSVGSQSPDEMEERQSAPQPPHPPLHLVIAGVGVDGGGRAGHVAVRATSVPCLGGESCRRITGACPVRVVRFRLRKDGRRRSRPAPSRQRRKPAPVPASVGTAAMHREAPRAPASSIDRVVVGVPAVGQETRSGTLQGRAGVPEGCGGGLVRQKAGGPRERRVVLAGDLPRPTSRRSL